LANRHLRGDIHPLIVGVRSTVVIAAGDLLFSNTTAGITPSFNTSADNLAYPLTDFMATTGGVFAAGIISKNFLGVAMQDSQSGVTEKITVATAGVFRFPLHTAHVPGGVTIGSKVSAVSREITAGTGTGVSSGHVIMNTSNPGSTCYLGYCVKTESGASFVDFQLRTAFGPGGVVGQ